MRNLNFVIFDMDGLIFDTERQVFEAMRSVAKEIGIEYQLDDFKRTIGVNDEKTKELMVDKYGEAFSEVMKRYREEFNNILHEEGLRVKPGVLELLNMLDQKNIMRCIASASKRDVIKRFLEMSNLEDRFDFYISGSEVDRGKPYPDIFLKACELANKKEKDTIVIEDSLHGLKAAVAANIKCIIVPDLIEPDNEMKRLAHRICDDLNEVAKLIKMNLI